MAILEFKNLCKGFGTGLQRREVLRNITLAVEEGEFLAILGFSGTGKTTLINQMAGLSQPDSGEVLFRNKPITGPGPERGVVFQSYSLMPWLTVAGNVALAVDAVHKSAGRAERAAIVDKYIAMVGLSHAKTRYPAELSGGMRQRVSVARALAMTPEVLLLDEPLSALDALTRANLQDEITRIWQADQKTVVLITNDVDEALLLADRIIPLAPDGTLGTAFKVALPRPRIRSAMNNDPAFKRLRADVTKYLMEVGIAAKVAETRHLPQITPIHGTPKAYAVIGPQMQFRPAPDSGSTYEIEMTYYAKVTPLTSSQETASTLTAYPALYLQACLTEAYLYLHDQQGAARHLPLRDRLIEQTNTATENHQYSAGPLTINHGMRGIEGAFR